MGKFALLSAAIRREWFVLAALGLGAMALTAIAGGALLLALIAPAEKKETTDQVSSKLQTLPNDQRVFLSLAAAPLLVAALFAESLLRWASLSLRFIFW